MGAQQRGCTAKKLSGIPNKNADFGKRCSWKKIVLHSSVLDALDSIAIDCCRSTTTLLALAVTR